LSEYERSIYQRQEALAKHGPLRGLELFSGAGGLGTGFDMSRYVETKWAVEFDGAAAKSYQNNHPNTTVYCQDSNALLQHAILTSEGQKPAPLLSNYKDPKAPKCDSMPRRDEVDIIYGGPPCQAFSRANHSPQVNDLRSTLSTNMLSYLEFYGPDYFLLENVVGLLQYSCKATQSSRKTKGGKATQSGRKTKEGIEMGMVKLIVRTLIALGYQARFKILQAGQYGCPQYRERIIFWGAKRGLRLPDFPIPTHAFKAQSWKLPIDWTGKQVLQPASRCPDPDPKKRHTFAPLKPVSVNDAIGDLPPFDWVNPHRIIPARQNEGKSSVKSILQCDAVLGDPKQDMPGYPQATSYFQEPCNAYQRWSRTNFTTGQMTTEV
ncbi:S-adenosyl-L-methionine-dependent methyltransferase, partial [Dendrothele bispora CBS 962.96]